MLESMFEVLQDMLFVLDGEGRITAYHGAADDKLYVPPEAFLGKTMRDVLPNNIATLIHRELELASNGQLREFEYALELPNGPHRFNAPLARLPETDE